MLKHSQDSREYLTARTVYDPNEYILHDDYAECITYDKEGNETARVKVDLDKVEELKQYTFVNRVEMLGMLL